MLKPALYLLAAYELAIGLFMLVAPGAFFDALGPFGARNDHYIRDMATWELALGAVALVAARREAWRLPVIALAVVHFALHTVNHLVDIGDAVPRSAGTTAFVSLLIGTLALAFVWRRAARA